MENIGSGDLSGVLGGLDRKSMAGLMNTAKTLMSAPKIKKNLEKLKVSYMEMKQEYKENDLVNKEKADQLITEFEKLREGVATISSLLLGEPDAISVLSTITGGGSSTAAGIEQLTKAPQLIDEYIKSLKIMAGELPKEVPQEPAPQ
jgi:glutamine synthetase adenylyltransferase